MKKLIQMILTGTMIVSMSLNAQQDAKNFVQQYKKQDGFTVISIGKPAMCMLSLFAKTSMDREAAEMLKRIDAIHVLVFERGNDKARSESFISDALIFCNVNRFEELIEVVEHNETVKIFGKTEGETIIGLIVLNTSKRGDSAQMVCLTGKFTIDDLQSINGKNGKNIAGI